MEGAEIYKIVRLIMEKKLDPVIIFSFSKKDVEGYGSQMARMDLTTPEQKEIIEQTFKQALSQLSEED